MSKVSIGIGNFYYFNFSFIEILEYLKKFTGFNGIEIVVKHGYVFSEDEINELKKYKYNTLHLLGFQKKDIEWMKYCIQTIPNFHHFTLHPDNADLDEIISDIEKYISFENMDPRKSGYQTPKEMLGLFDRFPNAGFTFDINHAEENNIPYEKFDIIKKPNKIHFSVVNKDYYKDYPEIQTPHALACLEEGFDFPLSKYKDIIITLEGVFLPGRDDLIQKEIDLVNGLLNK